LLGLAQNELPFRTYCFKHRRGGGDNLTTESRIPEKVKLQRHPSVGIATGCGLYGPGIESRWRRDFPHLSRPALGPTQLSARWVPGLSRGVKSGRGVKLTPHPLLVSWSRKSRAIPLLPLSAVQPVQSLSACTMVYFTFMYQVR